MKYGSIVMLPFLSLGLIDCGHRSDEPRSNVDDTVIFEPLRDDAIPKDLTLIKTLDWPTAAQAADRGHVNEHEFDPEYDVSHLQNYAYRHLDASKFCMQLVKSRSSRLVMIHNQPCPQDRSELLANDRLYLWLVVDENERDLYLRGYRVGALIKKSVEGVNLHYVSDLCTYTNYRASPLSGTASICNLYLADGQIKGATIRTVPRNPRIQLKGFKYADDIPFRGKVEPATCAEPIYDGVSRGCTAAGSRTSDACYAAGYTLLACGDCTHICSANFSN